MHRTRTTALVGLTVLLAAVSATAQQPCVLAPSSRAALTRLSSLEHDERDDYVGHCHVGWPGRVMFIDDGEDEVARGGRGLGAAPKAFVPLLTQADAWQALPTLEQGKQSRLPLWVLATAKALPRTTAAVLELEHRHRAASPLDAKLRGQIRLVVAHANQCDYTQAQAAADLRRAGVTAQHIKDLLAGEESLPPVLSFARKLTLAAYTVTDAEVADVAKSLGEKQLVAVVQLVAFSNFQDRLLLALGIPAEPDGPLPSSDWRFAKESKAMDRPAWPTALAKNVAKVADPEWKAFSFSDLKKGLEAQKERPQRIRVPTWDEVKVNLPPEAQKRELRVKWSLVCQGYQPQLAQGWSACTRAFREEAAIDRVFEESLFWIVTRTLQCFY